MLVVMVSFFVYSHQYENIVDSFRTEVIEMVSFVITRVIFWYCLSFYMVHSRWSCKTSVCTTGCSNLNGKEVDGRVGDRVETSETETSSGIQDGDIGDR